MEPTIRNISSERDPLAPHFTFTGKMHTTIDPILLMEIFRLRYEVYCLECRFLDPLAYQDGLEVDTYDKRSFHVASQNLEGTIVGSIRLVLAREEQEFPFEKHCPTFDDFTFPPREQCAEVSRLVVKKSYRRRAGDSFQGVTREFQEQGDVIDIEQFIHNNERAAQERRSNSPQILLGMYREIYRFSRNNGIHYWFAAMERSLVRILGQLGLRFIPIGPQADYYGKVRTYTANLDEMEADLHKANPFLASWFKKDAKMD